VTAPVLQLSDLQGDAQRRRRERQVRVVLRSAALLSVVIGALIVLSLVSEAWTFLSQVELTKLTDIGWYPRRNYFDVSTLVAGTLIVTGVAMVVAVPLGLGVAVYLSEYARPRMRRVLKPLIEILAGIPSVVLGFFALTWISPNIVDRFFSPRTPNNLLSAGIGVGILVIPLVASISEDALRAVPLSLREASYGVGARKVQTVARVVIPAAVSGLVAAFIVAVSRAIGETLVVTIAAGASGGSLFSTSPLDQGLTMTAAMATVAAGTDQVAGQGPTFQSLFFIGLVLFAITLTLNVVADRFVRRVRQKY
jgi:phosphate transport system permease protein